MKTQTWSFSIHLNAQPQLCDYASIDLSPDTYTTRWLESRGNLNFSSLDLTSTAQLSSM